MPVGRLWLLVEVVRSGCLMQDITFRRLRWKMSVDFGDGQVECCMPGLREFCIGGPWAKGVPELSG